MSKQKLILSDTWTPTNGQFDIRIILGQEVMRLLASREYEVVNIIGDPVTANALQAVIAPTRLPEPLERSQWAVPHDALVMQVKPSQFDWTFTLVRRLEERQ